MMTWLTKLLGLLFLGVAASAASAQSNIDGLLHYLAEPANPLDLNVTVDDGHAVSKVIGSEGGEISLADAKDARYLLTIPKNALPMPVAIKLTPVKSAAGLPDVEKVTLGLEMEPSGLVFHLPARLTVSLPLDIGEGRPVFALAAEAEGKDAHLVPAINRSGKFELLVEHFSYSFLEAAGPQAEDEGIQAGNEYLTIIDTFRARQDRARIESYLRKMLATAHDCAMRTGKGCEPKDMQKTCGELVELAPRHADASLKALALPGTSCEAATKTIFDNFNIARTQDLLGCPQSDNFLRHRVPVKINGQRRDLSPAQLVSAVCRKNKRAMCQDTGNVAELLNAAISIERGAEFLGDGSGEDSDFTDILASCGSFEITMTNKDRHEDVDTVNCRNHVKREVTLKAVALPQSGKLGTWSGTVDQETGAYSHTITCSKGDWGRAVSLTPSEPGEVEMTLLTERLADGKANIHHYLVAIDPGRIMMKWLVNGEATSWDIWWTRDFIEAYKSYKAGNKLQFRVPETGQIPIVAKMPLQGFADYASDGCCQTHDQFDSEMTIKHVPSTVADETIEIEPAE